MNKQTALFLLFCFLCSFKVNAQRITVSGFVFDKKSNERLIGAHVWSSAMKVGTVSNAFGFYTLQIDSLPIKLKISYIGYDDKELDINSYEQAEINIGLIANNTIAEVKVVAAGELPIEQRNEISVISISRRDLDMLPTLGGERDIIKAYQLMPGVQSGGEGKSGMYVRGGSPDQNLTLLDDVPIYYVNHLGGFTSVFNQDAINTTSLIKGGFPASYGSRLSSVLDVRMKEGNSKDFHTAFSIGLLSSKVLFEGPIEKDTSAFLISARRFMYDLLSRPVTFLATGTTTMGYSFYDINLKANRIMDNRNRLFVSFYMGDDNISMKTKDEQYNVKYSERWGNVLGALRWNHRFSDKLFSNSVLSYTRYRYKNTLTNDSKDSLGSFKGENVFFSGLNDFSLHPSFELSPTNTYSLKFGALGVAHFYQPGETSFYSAVDNAVIIDSSSVINTKAVELAGYVENKFHLPVGVMANIGLRYSAYLVEKQWYNSFEPRLLLSYLCFNKVKLSASYSLMQQYVHLLSNSSSGMPVEFWVPATTKAPPSSSEQFTLGFSTTLFKQFEFSVESYYKTMNDLIAFKEGASYFGSTKAWHEKVETNGFGEVYGLEFLLQKKYGKVTGWLAYTWSQNMRQFTNLNQGTPYPYKFDKTHDISIVCNYKLSKKVDFSATWVYNTGQALTLPSTKYYTATAWPHDRASLGELDSDEISRVFVYEGKNGFRGNAYHRLDIGVNFRKEKLRGKRTWNLSIYNLYNRQNPYFYYVGDYSNNGNGSSKIVQKSYFPFIPSITYSFDFY